MTPAKLCPCTQPGRVGSACPEAALAWEQGYVPCRPGGQEAKGSPDEPLMGSQLLAGVFLGREGAAGGCSSDCVARGRILDAGHFWDIRNQTGATREASCLPCVCLYGQPHHGCRTMNQPHPSQPVSGLPVSGHNCHWSFRPFSGSDKTKRMGSPDLCKPMPILPGAGMLSQPPGTATRCPAPTCNTVAPVPSACSQRT